MNKPATFQSAFDLLLGLDADTLGYDHPDRSYAPIWSNFGLGFGKDAGIEALYLYYNRQTLTFGGGAIATGQPVAHHKADVTGVTSGPFSVAFCDTDTFVIESHAPVSLNLFTHPDLNIIADWHDANGIRHLHAMTRTRDPRDPDTFVPLLFSLRVMAGQAQGDRLIPPTDGPLRAALRLEVLTIDPARAASRLHSAPQNVAEARLHGRAWAKQALAGLTLCPSDRREAVVLARALLTLLFNTKAPPGLLEGRLASYPARGGYPTHFLWDACFHMLALTDMQPRLARDALLVISDNMRPDGLMPHFSCSTWIRPLASQPALFGWAAERLVNLTGDLELAADVLPMLRRNTDWWLTQRMTRTGLVACFDPFETGWDDTPRLDKGPIIACDMNAYVLIQMRSTARLATRIGDTGLAAQETARADAFAARIVERMFDPDTGFFHDILLADGTRSPILSPAVFLPLLGDLPLPDHIVQHMLSRGLLDPARLFGHIPFPCVAYDDPAYTPRTMWRGPMWPPIYWLLLEILEKFGRGEARTQAAARLYEIILNDGNLHEYFDSQTGAGLGYPQQGWTAAILLRLHLDKIRT